MIFDDRHQAGEKLALSLLPFKGQKDVIVAGLARGGVVVAHSVAQKLELPLDVIIIRKIGAPHNEELAVGAIDENGEGLLNESIISALGVSRAYLKDETERQRQIAQKRLETYGRKGHTFRGKTVILVDDGIATGASMKAAIHCTKKKGAKKIIVAVPVASPDTIEEIKPTVDSVVCLYEPLNFQAVGQFYELFDQTTDAEVISLLIGKSGI
ncbi:MAG: phosphoribosyltransferase [Verrucomicrobia bacterium]|nr:phosphoribosyltransferase [Verrucomicrobiota bacterium]